MDNMAMDELRRLCIKFGLLKEVKISRKEAREIDEANSISVVKYLGGCYKIKPVPISQEDRELLIKLKTLNALTTIRNIAVFNVTLIVIDLVLTVIAALKLYSLLH